MNGVNFEKLVEKFNEWATNYVELEKSAWCSMDGKSIRGTVNNHDSHIQNFVSIVSVFASKKGLIVGMEQFENKHKSEIEVVQELIVALDLTGVVLTLDSLHCQKSGCNRAEVSSACVAPSKLVS
jgi:hypothetical protein